ncbi:MAG: hypothetical protein IPP88_20850 [Betaproteobacteria bacterium]|nr:hypothetical protein [Betaproteobacteria bacterium]
MHVFIIRVIVCIACGLGAFFAFESSAQALIAVQSRKVHAAVGTYDIKVDTTKSISGAITVDPRAIGSGHRIVFQFDGPAITPASVTVVDPQGATIGANTISVLGTEVSVDLTGIPDNSRVTVSLRDGAASVYASASLGFLRGDVNNNRAVDSNDVSAVKVRSGLAASTTNVRFDVGTSGAINASDIAAVKSRIGNALAVAGQQAKLTLVKAGTGSGTLSGSGILFTASAGIACPPAAPGVCSSSSAYFDVGSTVTLTATPASGSAFSGWSGLCASGTIVIAADSSCTATFAGPVTYAVTPSTGANGTISPASVQNIVQGATTTFTVTPGIGYTASVAGTCGGALVGTTYTTNAISAACTVVASFSSVNFSVTPSAGTNGVINPSTVQTVPQGTTKTFTVSPNANYTPSVAGTCGGTLTGLSYTTNPVTANCTVSATFVRLSYTVTPSAGANGTISPATAQTVLNGATRAFVVTPSAGYAAIVGGTCGGTLVGTTYTTNSITGLCSVVATFVSNTPKYVSTTGNDSTGDGTIGNPWKTIGKGISMLVGGESLIVRNGIYSGTSNFITAVPSGISTRYTTITAETPMQVRIQSTSALGVGNNQLQLTGSYIKVDGFIFDMTGTTNPAFTGLISGSFNTLSRSIFKRGGDIDAFGGLLEVTGSDNLLEDMAGTGACAICFKQGGATVTTQRNIWRRVIGRFDYSNSSQPKATFATFGGATVGNVRDHLYQNVIAIDGQNPGTLGGAEKMGGFYAAQNTANITLQGSMVLNEGAGSAGMFLRELGSINNTSHSVVWDLRNGLSGATGMVGGNADHLTIGGIIPGAAVDLITSATASLLKPGTNPANLLNNTPGAVMLKQYGLSGTRWGQTGYDQITSVDLWPWPYQDTIKSVFREANNVPAGNGPAQNDTLRGFAANGTALYGGAKTFTSYIWEYLGAPCPPTACVTYTVTPSAGANGTISPTTPQTVLPGSTLIFTLTPNAGYTSSVGGTCGGTLVGSTYTTNLISASCTIVASFNTFKTYYVSNSGNNANTCAAALSSGTPKQTIQAGLACLAAGDSLVIRDGIYSGAANALTSLPNGTAGNYITIKAENEGA